MRFQPCIAMLFVLSLSACNRGAPVPAAWTPAPASATAPSPDSAAAAAAPIPMQPARSAPSPASTALALAQHKLAAARNSATGGIGPCANLRDQALDSCIDREASRQVAEAMASGQASNTYDPDQLDVGPGRADRDAAEQEFREAQAARDRELMERDAAQARLASSGDEQLDSRDAQVLRNGPYARGNGYPQDDRYARDDRYPRDDRYARGDRYAPDDPYDDGAVQEPFPPDDEGVIYDEPPPDDAAYPPGA